MEAKLESELPERLVVGRGNTLSIHGWAFDPESRISELRIYAGEQSQPVLAHSAPRGGFWGMLEIERRQFPAQLPIEIEADLDDGRRLRQRVGELEVTPASPLDPRAERWHRGFPRDRKRICICMATYEPDPQLFEVQLESIRAQTLTDWTCLICDDGSSEESFRRILDEVKDDERFVIYRGAERSGFYRNFERALSFVPLNYDLVALADQDDRWHPEKLAVLSRAIGEDKLLAYCNMRVVQRVDGELKPTGETYWEAVGRRNEYRRLGSMLLANCVTGAASVFRRHLVGYLLPLPEPPGVNLHDHWLACVARTLGEIAFVDRPLHDHVIHGGNVTFSIELPWRENGDPAELYARELLHVVAFSRTLQLRCGDLAARRQRRALRRTANLTDLPGIAWLLRRSLIPPRLRTETMGLEPMLLRAARWRPPAPPGLMGQ